MASASRGMFRPPRVGAAVFDLLVHAGQLGTDDLGSGLRKKPADDRRGDAGVRP